MCGVFDKLYASDLFDITVSEKTLPFDDTLLASSGGCYNTLFFLFFSPANKEKFYND